MSSHDDLVFVQYCRLQEHSLVSGLVVVALVLLGLFQRPFGRRHPRVLDAFSHVCKYSVFLCAGLFLANQLLVRVGPYGLWTAIVLRALNCLLFLRLVVRAFSVHGNQWFEMSVESWLLVHLAWEVKVGAFFLRYDFLALARLWYPFLWQYSRDQRRLLGFLTLLGGLAVMAGVMEVLDYRRDTLSLSYFYMATMTVSTIGYGDLRPVSDGSKVVFCLFIFVAAVWFRVRIAMLYDDLVEAKGRLRPIPCQGSKPRSAILFSGVENALSDILRPLSKDRSDRWLIVTESQTDISSGLVFRRAITPSLLRELFRIQNPEDEVILVNKEECDDFLADSKVFDWLRMVKTTVPHVRVVMNVRLDDTREAIRDLPYWSASDVFF